MGEFEEAAKIPLLEPGCEGEKRKTMSVELPKPTLAVFQSTLSPSPV